MTYTVRRLRPRALLPAVLLVVWIAFLAVLGTDPLPAWFYVAAALLVAWNVWRASRLLQVDAAGVRLGPAVVVPWSSIEAVAVAPGRVGLQLRPDAPLPRGVRRPDGSPETPPALQLDVGTRLDEAALAAAVAAHGDGISVQHAG